jgi:hypothetical protein
MVIRFVPRSVRAGLTLIAILALGMPLTHRVAANQKAAKSGDDEIVTLTAVRPGLGGADACVMYTGTNRARIDCRGASFEESISMAEHEVGQSLRVVQRPRLNATGLTIVLRSTAQLDGFPEAKAAFVRAAEMWESLIQSPITVVVDVDFGPNWFGHPFSEGVLGYANPQMLIANPGYTTVTRRLASSATNQKEWDFYNSLPGIGVTTDLGDTAAVVAPSAVFRALGLIDAMADPVTDPGGFGPPPSIGINSDYDFDFDPSDGIDSDKWDFDAVVCHDLGHVLGFVSWAGENEMDASNPLAVSLWDLARVRPGTTMEDFQTATRILSSGGNQVYFNGDLERELSTGRPDGSGGDGSPASHWKDDQITGVRSGIMDPTMPQGRRQTITLTDMAAIDLFGYKVKSFSGNNPPVITQLTADLNGTVATLKGVSLDLDGDVSEAQTRFLDDSGQIVGQTVPFAVDIGVPTTNMFVFQVPGMDRFPGVVAIGLTLIDSKGNHSKEVMADFSNGDQDGPIILSVGYKGGKLNIKGKRFKGDLRIEVNSVVVSPPLTYERSGKKLRVVGSDAELNLRGGPNRVRVINDGLRSNIMVLDF